MVVPFQIVRTQSKSCWGIPFRRVLKGLTLLCMTSKENNYSFSHAPCLSPFKLSLSDHLLTWNGIIHASQACFIFGFILYSRNSTIAISLNLLSQWLTKAKNLTFARLHFMPVFVCCERFRRYNGNDVIWRGFFGEVYIHINI